MNVEPTQMVPASDWVGHRGAGSDGFRRLHREACFPQLTPALPASSICEPLRMNLCPTTCCIKAATGEAGRCPTRRRCDAEQWLCGFRSSDDRPGRWPPDSPARAKSPRRVRNSRGNISGWSLPRLSRNISAIAATNGLSSSLEIGRSPPRLLALAAPCVSHAGGEAEGVAVAAVSGRESCLTVF